MIKEINLPIEIKQTADKLETHGFEAYIVGGCVRDILLGKKPKDWDFTTNAHPDQIQNIFLDSFCNNEYGTVGVKHETPSDDSLHVIEITPYRSEGNYTDSRRPDHVTFGVSLEEDLSRRDFTMNAIAYRISNHELVDLYQGINDIKEKRIKTVGNPVERFTEDALRMMRAIRLASELDFFIDNETMQAISANNSKIKLISIERIASEFIRIIESDSPMQGIVFLEKLYLLEHIIPELMSGIGCEQGGIHAFDVYEHLLRTLQASADKKYSTNMRLSALFHDIGKPATRRTGGKNKMYTFFGHEVVGAKMCKKILNRLRLPKETVEQVTTLVRWHMFFSDPDKITLTAVRRTIARVGRKNIEDLLNLRVCDRIGTGRPKEQPFRFRKYKAMVDQALRDPISVKMLCINGENIMEITGEKPSKKVGYILHSLLEEVLKDPNKNNLTYLEQRVKKLASKPESELKMMSEAGRKKQDEEENKILQEIARMHKVG